MGEPRWQTWPLRARVLLLAAMLLLLLLGAADAVAQRQCDDDASFDKFDKAVTELEGLFQEQERGTTPRTASTEDLTADLAELSRCEGRLGRRALFYLARLHGLKGEVNEEQDAVARLRARQLSPEETKELGNHYPKAGARAAERRPPAARLVVATGVSFPPFYDHTGASPRGFDVDLAEELARRLGRSGVRFSSGRGVRERTRKGEAELGIAAITINESRRRQTPFSRPYLTSEVVAVGSAFRSLPVDLSEARCSVNSNHALYVNLLKKTGCRIVGRDSHQSAMRAVLDGSADFTPRDVSADILDGLLVTGRVLDKDALGIAFPPGADELRGLVDDILADLEAEGWLLDRARQHGLKLPADDSPAP